jgi:excinuclease UvrABC helicase subunit UvrB
VPTAKLLVVTANIGEARRHFRTLAENGYAAGLATSHDSQEAVDRIEDFRSGRVNILVTIAMAYDGLDIPEISHIACLTHIRSKPWIEQMFARAVRINKHAGECLDQIAYIFAPDDILMRELVQDIEREQVRSAQDAGAKKLILTSLEKEGRPGIIPLGSAATKQREATLNATPKTPKQKEELVLREIEGHIRRFSFANRLDPWTVNTELVREFGKPRRSMRMPELLKLLRHINKVYPLGRPIRGTGRPRVPTQAEFVQNGLFDTKFMKGFKY